MMEVIRDNNADIIDHPIRSGEVVRTYTKVVSEQEKNNFLQNE